MKKALTIEELKERIGKPVFVVATTEDFKYGTAWHILSKITAFKLDNESDGHVEFTDCKCIKFEHIQFYKFFDEEVTALELKEILDAEKKTKKTGYERLGKGASYYTINIFKEVVSFIDDEFSEIYTETSYFNDENLAKNIARAEQLKYKLRRYAALNGGIPSLKDWQNQYRNKHYIFYDCDENKIYVCDTSDYKDFGQIYFKNKEACKKAIEIFKKELIWYFTEFEEQLY